ncbi:MAG: MATE family efflux transporter [Oscillospiraceae bacterium]|nr:MATE family efflux transporter [Oscillospiraceae bacterium]
MKTAAIEGKKEVYFSNRDLTLLIAPLLLEQLLSITVGLADSLMVSSVGDAAISAVSLVDSISNLMLYIFSAMATGGAVVAGQYIGRREEEKARRSGQQMMALVLIVAAVICAALYLFKGSIISGLFGQIDEDVRAATDTYYSIVMASIPSIALYNGGAALMRAMARTDLTLKISLLSNVINVAGNAILIFGCGCGVEGVAIPTFVSRTAAAIVMLVLLHDQKRALNIAGLRAFRFERRTLWDIVRIGIPSGLENGMFNFGKLMLYSLISTFGTASITANAIGATMGMFHCFAGSAVGMGMVTVISRCIGAGDYKAAKYYFKKLMLISFAAMFFVNLLLALAVPLTVRAYGLDGETAALTAKVLLVHGIAGMVLWVPSFNTPQFLRAAGDSGYTLIVSALSMWLLRVAPAYVLGTYFSWGVVGVWFAQSVFDWSARSICFFLRDRSEKWKNHGVKG